MKLEPYHISCTRVNSKCIKFWNIRPETVKFLEENIKEKLNEIGIGNDFMAKSRGNIAKIDKWD